MKFNSKSGQELRTWILFIVGIALVILFAIKETPLDPWWTLIIGAFTCTAIIVSAVQATFGGIRDAAQKAVDEARKVEQHEVERDETPPDSLAMGHPGFAPLYGIYCRNASPI